MPHRIPLILAAAAAIAFLAITGAVVTHWTILQRSDAAISAWAHGITLAHPRWRATMSAVTLTGSTTYLDPLTAVAGIALLIWRRWRQAAFVLIATVSTAGVRLFVLANVARPRPVDWLTNASGWSFPSGHSTASATAALAAIVVARSLLPQRRVCAILAAVVGAWAITVGVSRIALTVHWPSDVLAAWLLVTAIVPALAVVLGVSQTPSKS